MKRLNLQTRLLCLTISLIAATANLLAGYIPDDSGHGFTLCFDRDLNKLADNPLPDLDPDKRVQNNLAYRTRATLYSPVEFYALWFSSIDPYDYLFSRITSSETDSRFVINSYENNKRYYIDRLEIDWVLDENCIGALRLVGSGSETNPYDCITMNKEEDYIDKTVPNDINLLITPPSDESNTKFVYNFDIPVSYIALVYHSEYNFNQELNKKDYNSCARFSSFSVHFTDEPVVPKPKVKVTLGSDKEVENLPWCNTGINANHLLSISGDVEKLSADDLKFYLTPLFDSPNSKPNPEAEERPEELWPLGWTLYKHLESVADRHEFLYDGYWPADATRIECKFNPADNSLIIPAPCSGRYKLWVDATEDIKLEANELELNIWPDIENNYEWLGDFVRIPEESKYQLSFSINWQNFDTVNVDSHKNISHPVDTDGNLDHGSTAVIFVPGLYDAQIYYRLSSSTTGGDNNSEKEFVHRNVNASSDASVYAINDNVDGLEGYSPVINHIVDISSVSSTTLMQLRISKNGALTPLVSEGGNSETAFTITPSTGIDYNDALGVSSPLSDSNTSSTSQPIYYDLQGRRVNPANNNPALLPSGIYIKVIDGRPSKIIQH